MSRIPTSVRMVSSWALLSALAACNDSPGVDFMKQMSEASARQISTKLQVSCDLQRKKQKRAVIERLGIELMAAQARKVVAQLSSDDLETLKQLRYVPSWGGPSSELDKATQSAVEDIYAQAAVNAGVSQEQSWITDGRIMRVRPVAPAGGGSRSDEVTLVTQWMSSGDLDSVGDVDLRVNSDLSRFPVTLMVYDAAATAKAQAENPKVSSVHVPMTLWRYVSAKLPAECANAGTLLSSDEFESVRGLSP